MNRALARLAAAAVLAVTTAAAVALALSVPPPGAAVPAGRAWRICPVASCAAYPDPADVRGITIATLQNYVLYLRAAKLQISAARSWNANTIRLQIVQDKMVGQSGTRFSPVYMRAVRQITGYALRHGLDVVLNAQTEISMGFARNESLPTTATYAFWRRMTAAYGRNPRVVFDLFNEPRGPDGCPWPVWQAAFQPLVNYVRRIGSRNQIWVEGRDWASTLAGVPLLHGQGLVYSFHHPGSPHPAPDGLPATPAVWDAAFGNLAARGVPVVDGEFVNFMSGYYWPRSTATVTRYFAYLRSHQVGVVAWSLPPGIMTTADGPATAVSEPQGVGRLFWRYFHGTLPPPGAPQLALAAGEGHARRLAGAWHAVRRRSSA